MYASVLTESDAAGRLQRASLKIEIMMGIYSRCATLFAAWRNAAFTSRPRRKSRSHEHARKVELHEWENEGGNLAPSAEAAESRVTTGSA